MSTYFNKGGVVRMKAKASGRALVSQDGHYEGSMRVMDATGPSGEDVTLLVWTFWTKGVCHHKVADAETGVTVAEGRGHPKESESWVMATEMLALRGYEIG